MTSAMRQGGDRLPATGSSITTSSRSADQVFLIKGILETIFFFDPVGVHAAALGRLGIGCKETAKVAWKLVKDLG